MNPSSYPPPAVIFISLLVLSISLPRHVRSDEEKFNSCAPSFCGDKKVDYPFWGHHRPDYCGLDGFKVDCFVDVLTLEIKSLEYDIKKMDLDNPFLSLKRADFLPNTCPEPVSTSLDGTPFSTTSADETARFRYNCALEDLIPYNFTCFVENINHQGYLLFPGIPVDELKCNITVEIPVLKTAIAAFMWRQISVQEVVNEGFEVDWIIDLGHLEQCIKCNKSGGRCGRGLDNSFNCFCPDDSTSCKSYFPQAPGSNTVQSTKRPGVQKHWRVKVIIIIGSLSVGIGFLCASMFCYVRKRRKSHVFLANILQGEKQNNRDIEAFMRNYGSLIPTRYTYADVKKITHLFKEKLGQGGFGTVYKGKIPDGRLVAVKMLNETKGNGEEFINEVASISRTSHVNVVSLLGFCLERHKRALIYEFMSNGSLDQFIGSENQQNTEQHLDWEKLYQIAIGVARGLEYLHRGCNTRIVHFDIKPHNILLDKDFFPKISDFGLAKLCTKEKSILSLLEARGTIGYIAPEVFSRNFGVVSHKSDVYSYGMVLLEMVGEKKKDDNVASDASEKYFPYWVYEHVELNNFRDLGVSAVEDIEIIRKMAIVGLWCIQTNPSDRPSMSKVIEMFERNTEILEVPPKPFLFSPTKSTSDPRTLLSLFNIPSSSSNSL